MSIEKLERKYEELMSLQTEQNSILMEIVNRMRKMEKDISVLEKKRGKGVGY